MITKQIASAVLLCAASAFLSTQATANLQYAAHDADGTPYVLISGTFDFADDLTAFRQFVLDHHPVFATFDSAGGNVVKAMELGRAIRAAGLWHDTAEGP